MIWQIICPSLSIITKLKKKIVPQLFNYILFLASSLETYQKIELENIFIGISSLVENNALKIINWFIVLRKLKSHQLKQGCLYS